MTTKNIALALPDETATLACAAQVAQACTNDGCSIFLHGELGAGKTTWVRGFLTALGVSTHVKSPTFTVVEPYEIKDEVNCRYAYHFDLYRIVDAEELELLGVRDYFAPQNILLVEWPEQGAGVLPEADLHVYLSYAGSARAVNLVASSTRGQLMLDKITPGIFL